MPDVRLPDGTIVKNVPAGTTKAQLMEKLGREYSPEQEPAPRVSMFDRDYRAGLLETGAQLITGAISTPLAGLAGIGTGLVPGGRTATEGVEDVSGALTYAPRTTAGQQVSNIVAWPFQKLEQGADYIGEVSGDEDDVLGATAVKTALLGAPAALGFRGMKPKPPTNRQVVAAQAQKNGYVVDPASTNTAAGAGAIEGFGGKIKTQQLASLRNQANTDRLAARALGMEEGAPITVEGLAARRFELSQAHKDLRGTGTVTTDIAYRRAAADASQGVKKVSNDFPELFSAADKNAAATLDALAKKAAFDADSAVSAVQILRERADSAFLAGEKTTASAWKKAATAIEDAIERDLVRRGETGLVERFRHARQEIAKTYSVQDALQGANVSATKLAAQLKKNKPLSGELLEIARFATEFPKITRVFKEAIPNFSPLDLGVQGGSAAAALVTGNMAAALPFFLSAARPLLRNLALGKTGQKMATATGTEGAVSPGLIGSSLLQQGLFDQATNPEKKE